MVSSERDVTKRRGIHISRRVRGVSALIRWVRNRVWVGQCLEGGFVIDEAFFRIVAFKRAQDAHSPDAHSSLSGGDESREREFQLNSRF